MGKPTATTGRPRDHISRPIRHTGRNQNLDHVIVRIINRLGTIHANPGNHAITRRSTQAGNREHIGGSINGANPVRSISHIKRATWPKRHAHRRMEFCIRPLTIGDRCGGIRNPRNRRNRPPKRGGSELTDHAIAIIGHIKITLSINGNSLRRRKLRHNTRPIDIPCSTQRTGDRGNMPAIISERNHPDRVIIRHIQIPQRVPGNPIERGERSIRANAVSGNRGITRSHNIRFSPSGAIG